MCQSGSYSIQYQGRYDYCMFVCVCVNNNRQLFFEGNHFQITNRSDTTLKEQLKVLLGMGLGPLGKRLGWFELHCVWGSWKLALKVLPVIASSLLPSAGETDVIPGNCKSQGS